MEYKELLKNRRSVRNFLNKKVPMEAIHEIIQDTCLAPSACDRQPWRFIIIQNVDLIKRISDESKKNILMHIEKNPNPSSKQFESMVKNSKYNVFYNATTLVLICGIKDESFAATYLREDCSLAAAYFMLSATEKKLSTCWIGLGDKIFDKKLRMEIGLTEELEVIAPLIIGYSNSISDIPNRKPIILKEIGN